MSSIILKGKKMGKCVKCLPVLIKRNKINVKQRQQQKQQQ